MPPKAKKPTRKKKNISEPSQTQPRLNFEPPVKDPLEQRQKLMSKIEGIRANMTKLQEEEEKYMRQFLKNQMRINAKESTGTLEQKIDVDNHGGIRYTLEFPSKADILDVILGGYSMFQDELFKDEGDQQTSPETNEAKQAEQCEKEQEMWLKPQFLKDFEPGFIRILNEISTEEKRERGSENPSV